MFWSMLKKRVATNYRQAGGFIGLLGLLSIFAVLILPPFAVLEILDIQKFTAMRLVPPLIWVVYLLLGSRMLSERLHPRDALRLLVWPLRKA